MSADIIPCDAALSECDVVEITHFFLHFARLHAFAVFSHEGRHLPKENIEVDSGSRPAPGNAGWQAEKGLLR